VQSSEASSRHLVDTFITSLRHIYYSAGVRSGCDRTETCCEHAGQCGCGMVLNAQPHPITFYHF